MNVQICRGDSLIGRIGCVIYTSSVTLRATPRCFASQNSVVACDLVLPLEKAFFSVACDFVLPLEKGFFSVACDLVLPLEKALDSRGREVPQNAQHTRLHLSGELSADKAD